MKEENIKGWIVIGLSVAGVIAFIAICLTFFGLPLLLILLWLALKRRAKDQKKLPERRKVQGEKEKIPYGRRI